MVWTIRWRLLAAKCILNKTKAVTHRTYNNNIYNTQCSHSGGHRKIIDFTLTYSFIPPGLVSRRFDFVFFCFRRNRFCDRALSMGLISNVRAPPVPTFLLDRTIAVYYMAFQHLLRRSNAEVAPGTLWVLCYSCLLRSVCDFGAKYFRPKSQKHTLIHIRKGKLSRLELW